MNICDTTDGGTKSNTESSTNPGLLTDGSRNASPVSLVSAETEMTSDEKPELIHTTNENLINTLKVDQEKEMKCTEDSNETAPTSSLTPIGAVTTASYAAIAAMDTATATAFINSCCQQQQQLSTKSEFDSNNSSEVITELVDNKSYRDENLIANIISSATPTTICDNNESTTTVMVSAIAESPTIITQFSGEGSRDGTQSDRAEKEAALVIESSSLPPPPPSIENLENKEQVLENISTTSSSSSPLSVVVPTSSALSGSSGSNCEEIAMNSNNKNNSGVITSYKSPRLMKRRINALTTTSSEPILMQCSGSGSNKNCKDELASVSGLSTSGEMISRRVSFPKSDEALVTGYLEPANPWEHICMINSISEIAEFYVQSCKKHNTAPIPSVLEHLKNVELNHSVRQPSLSLKSIKLEPADCEALEEIFKRVQYKSIDISSCELNETAASALFDMFEYYEVTNELDISSNSEGMTSRGWTSCIYMVSHSRALQVLIAQSNPLSKNSADNLGSALNSSNLHTIKLEHCGLRGFPLESLCLKLRNNQILKELWLAHNDLTCSDAEKIAQLLRTNHFLQLIDISNNNIKDDGLMQIVKALIEQSSDLERRRIEFAEAEQKKRQQAINNSTSTNANSSLDLNGMGTSTDDDMTSGDSDASPAEDEDDDDDEADDADIDTDANDAEDDDATTTDNGSISRAEDDDDDDDTVKTSTIKNPPPINGQSKLDKLLSMNNSDSSEDAPTDTVAASDISVSDDIFDSTNVVPVVASTPIAGLTIEEQERPVTNNNNNNEAASAVPVFEASNIMEETAAKADAVNAPTKALDVNKNATKTDDFDDTHSTDSAFESSSDADISRHLPDEFVSRFDNKEDVETAIIATEALITPTPTPPPILDMPQQSIPPTNPKQIEPASLKSLGSLAASASPNTSCDSSTGDISALKNAALTGTSPSPAGMRRTESTHTITQSTRARSHSSDSLSSDNSLDGSIGDSSKFSSKINERLTKNDTLTRQKQFDVPQDSSKTPNGLKALALWNNNLTKESGPLISDLLATTVSLELLNIGKNILSNDFVAAIRDSLSQNKTVTTLGLQSAHLSCAGIRTLSSILQFGGNCTLQRIDIRDNKIEVESLNMLAEALKSNTIVTQIDIDDEPKRLSIGSDAQLDYARVLENVRSLCSRNENQPPPTAPTTDKSTNVTTTKRRGGYYLGSRKISLTCHSAPPRSAIDQANTTPPSSKLEVKKKSGVRLRSPIPSPPTISPSSSPVPSPSRSRFQVFRVSEVSPLTSPMTPSPTPSPSPSPTPLSTVKDVNGVIINSKDNTTTIKRLSTSPRSRFQVMKIKEDLGIPVAHRVLPPITPSPSPPTAPSIGMSTSIKRLSTSSRTFEEQKIVTTPATPPIDENTITEAPSFSTTTNTASIASTDTKINPNTLNENNSTNIVKPNDQVDASVPVQLASSTLEKEQKEVIDEKLKYQIAPQLTTVEEDQRTLTNSPVNNSLINSIVNLNATACSNAQSESSDLTITILTTTQPAQESQDLSESQTFSPQPAASRTRKTSWIPNSTYPGTVDRLLSMFQNPAQIFQRSSSPDSTGKQQDDKQLFEAEQQPLVPVRKRSPPTATQFPSWCKLGTEMCKPVTTAMQTAAAVSGGYVASSSPSTAVVTAPVESPLSFFDAASKQLRDFSKQVFRQNIAFGNETNNPLINHDLQQQLQHDCDTIPSDMKLEIKENISPEHTINEETLHTLQKIGGSPGSSSTSSSGTETTEGASSISSSSSPSSLLSAPLIVKNSTPPSEVLSASSSANTQHTKEEQSCSS